ncbi:winged helix-turn-helix transcriptional regulator [Streptomyces anulatus]|uniref:winged helix-turn-helix transcriptional regulator n=1 Tax=Streptomyces anulatus TaxID=1892 RepID=UPI003661420E
MNNLFPGAFVVTAAGAVTAVVAAAQDNFGLCAAALVTVAAGAVGAYLISRSQDAATDRAVLRRLQESPHQPVEVLANEVGLRPAAVRLSIHRLTKAGMLTPKTVPTE